MDAVKDALKAFVEHLALNRHLSPHSVRAYTSDVEQYLARAAAVRGVKRSALALVHLDAESVRDFVVELNRAEQARSSVARKLSAVRTFLRFLVRAGLLSHDPSGAAVAPKLDRKVPRHLSEADMSTLLDTPDVATPLGRRDRAMLELFYASGLRLSELVGLDLDDVHLPARMVRVLGKGGKERLLPFNRTAEQALRQWLPDREVIRREHPPVAPGRASAALRRLGYLLKHSSRNCDYVARYGGEEFTIIVPEVSADSALRMAERIRDAVEKADFDGEAAMPRGRLTISIGVATFPTQAGNRDELLAHADRALYQAKAAGKNVVMVYGADRVN